MKKNIILAILTVGITLAAYAQSVTQPGLKGQECIDDCREKGNSKKRDCVSQGHNKPPYNLNCDTVGKAAEDKCLEGCE